MQLERQTPRETCRYIYLFQPLSQINAHSGYISDCHHYAFGSTLQKYDSISSLQILQRNDVDRYQNTRTQDAETHSRENKQYLVREHGGPNLSAQATAQKVVPHGRYHHITLKLGMDCGNPGLKPISWQEGRQAKADRETKCLTALLSPAQAGRLETCRILEQLARYSSCPEDRLATYWYLLVLLVFSVARDMETFLYSF